MCFELFLLPTQTRTHAHTHPNPHTHMQRIFVCILTRLYAGTCVSTRVLPVFCLYGLRVSIAFMVVNGGSTYRRQSMD
jgi:hypothetical protein